ncbi:thioredoxin-like protein [Conidiobolus coronatus NRRL 28638]|uniref:Thioredoxin-like protein n=1 Tax=Conidiobolus coronatus (strain ATCC 28846 / CBS 209.66 / NRRL 28638) TaxID=796925 RepID=A0A137PF38_CONC2|nr:thioredoxin-like protein [Conidiobolus coronatus NRRL 28638]|eukprot:KXN73585.1 thioredoxin-like protein [Conidiobolus coronatus NRRL 28638]
MPSINETIDKYISENTLMIFSKSYCPYCDKAKAAAKNLAGIKVDCVELDKVKDGNAIQKELFNRTGQTTVPNIFLKGSHVGGCDDFLAKIKNGAIKRLLGSN